jgi:predicted RNase H-like nuclease
MHRLAAANTPSATIGIDLSSRPPGTAACLIEWGQRGGRVVALPERLTDAAIVDLVRAAGVSKVAIDAPFGWPQEFVDAVAAHAAGERWPHVAAKALEFRTTDLYVQEVTKQWPLSVSTNYIAYLAFRCAKLLTELRDLFGPIDRSGDGLAVEVYPAGALRQWGLESRGYKQRTRGTDVQRRLQKETLVRLVSQILSATAGWLHVTDSYAARLRQSDDLLDALVAALVARANHVGLCLPIPQEHLAVAEVEGWIHLPLAEPLASFRPIQRA